MSTTQHTSLSPLGRVLVASPQFRDYCHTGQELTNGQSHPLIDSLIAFLATPAGQALEAAIVNLLLKLLLKSV